MNFSISCRGKPLFTISEVLSVRNKSTAKKIPASGEDNIHESPWRKTINAKFMYDPKRELPVKPRYLSGRYNPFSIKGVIDILQKNADETSIKDQLHDVQRDTTLGRDLAAAHFVVFRGGGVKFTKTPDFVRKQPGREYHEELPCIYDPSYLVEAIDTTDMQLHYEALENFKELKFLRSLSFKNNTLFDDWYLDCLCSLTPTLEYLDISYCTNVTYRGIIGLYRLKYLKGIIVEGVSDSVDFKLACLTLETEMPKLGVVGIPVDDTEQESQQS